MVQIDNVSKTASSARTLARRDFLRGGAVASFGLTGLGSTLAAAPQEKINIDTKVFDDLEKALRLEKARSVQDMAVDLFHQRTKSSTDYIEELVNNYVNAAKVIDQLHHLKKGIEANRFGNPKGSEIEVALHGAMSSIAKSTNYYKPAAFCGNGRYEKVEALKMLDNYILLDDLVQSKGSQDLIRESLERSVSYDRSKEKVEILKSLFKDFKDFEDMAHKSISSGKTIYEVDNGYDPTPNKLHLPDNFGEGDFSKELRSMRLARISRIVRVKHRQAYQQLKLD